MLKPPATANASLYDKSMRSGLTGQHMVSKISELMQGLKGATKGSGKGRKSVYSTKQAAKVVAAPTNAAKGIIPGMGGR